MIPAPIAGPLWNRGNPMESWVQTYSGQVVDLFNPDPETILIEDIAHALAHSCRYGGHSKDFYSVAQHSVFVSRLCMPENALWGLLHDAAEAYLTDIPAPLKQHLPDYRSFEHRFEAVIAQVFGLPLEIPEEIRAIDKQMLRVEHRDVMGYCGRPWAADALPRLDVVIDRLWNPETAKTSFMNRFRKLTNGNGGR